MKTNTMGTALIALGSALMLMTANGCASTSCRQGPKDDVNVAARTAGAGAKTGAESAVSGVKAAGSAVGGWVDGGSAEAKEKWEAGKADTKATANSNADQTRAEADVPECPR